MGPEGAGKVNFTQVSSQGRCLAVAPGQPGGNQGCLLTCSAPERVGRPATNHSDLPEVWPPGICSLRTEPSGKSAAKAQQVFKRRVEKSEQSGGLSAGLGPSCLHSRGGRGSQVKHADSTPSRKPLTHLPSQEAQPPPIHRPPSHRELEGQDSSSHRALLATEGGQGTNPQVLTQARPPGPRWPFLISAHRGPWGGQRPSLRMSQIQEGQDPSLPKYRPPRQDPHFVRWAEMPSSPSNTYICICL